MQLLHLKKKEKNDLMAAPSQYVEDKKSKTYIFVNAVLITRKEV